LYNKQDDAQCEMSVLELVLKF